MAIKSSRKISLAERCPDACNMWDYEKNLGGPEEVAVSSNKRVSWKCARGHEWVASIALFARGSRCPYCSGRLPIKGETDLATRNPRLATEWHPTKNGKLTPSDVMPGSSIKVWWLGKCGHEWEAVVSSRNRGNGCPYCSGRRILPGFNDLKTINPELAKEYSPDNPIPVNQISPFSHKYVLWNYPCGHCYSAMVKERHMKGHGCKYCNAGAVLPGFNDLQTLHPEIAKEWNTERNKKGPDQVRPKSNTVAYWICSFCGREYRMSPSDRSTHGCPHCSKESRVSIGEKMIAFYLDKAGFRVVESYHDKKTLGKMELDIYLPELKLGIEYDGRNYHGDSNRDYEKNARCRRQGIDLIRFREEGCPAMLGIESIDVDPNDYDSIAEGINKLLSLIRKQYGVEVSVFIDLKNELQTIIEKKYISRKSISLSTKYPQVANYLHPDVKINPNAIPYRSNIPFSWKCPDCGYEWTAVVSSVVHSFKEFGRTGCPKCAGKVLTPGQNDAATMDPIADSCWDADHNPDKLSDHLVSDLSVRKWKCIRCGQLFDRKIFVMCRKGSTHACKSCSKKISSNNRFKKVTGSGNNLLVEYPDIARYWDYNLNQDRPEDYTPNSEKEKNWICSSCGKSYKSRIIVRTRDGGNTLCSSCGKRRGADKFKIQSLKGGENTFASKYPELAKEWHPTLNGTLKPSDITPNYHEKVWWYCDKCKQAWDREPMVRIRGDRGCPICSGRRLCTGINDVATICPSIVPAWHPILNGEKKPEEFRCRDTTEVYWQCTKCGKVTKGSIHNKVLSGSPLCKRCKTEETLKRKKSSIS